MMCLAQLFLRSLRRYRLGVRKSLIGVRRSELRTA